MKRLFDWPDRLRAEIVRAREKQFSWGTFDCALFVCDCIKAMTGVDPAAPYRGKYQTCEQAQAEGSIEVIAGSVTSSLGMKEVQPAFATRGDVVLVDNGDPQKALGIIDLSGRHALCAGPRGLKRVSAKRWLKAWRV